MLVVQVSNAVDHQAVGYILTDLYLQQKSAELSYTARIACPHIKGSYRFQLWVSTSWCTTNKVRITASAMDGSQLTLTCATGKPVKDQEGTMVIRTAFPNMPLAFLDDPQGKRYQETYFVDFDHPVFNMVCF